MISVGAAFSRARLNHEKASSVARDVVVRIPRGRVQVVSGKELRRFHHSEDRISGNVHHHYLVAISVEQFSTVWIPDRLSRSVGRNLPLSPWTWVGSNITLQTAGLVGEIGYPAAIRGEPRGSFREPCPKKRLRAPIAELQSHDVRSRRLLREEQDLSVRRPRAWKITSGGQALLRSAAVRYTPVESSGAGACRPVRQPFSVRSPDWKLAAPVGYKFVGVASRERVNPDIESWSRHHDRYLQTIWRYPRYLVGPTGCIRGLNLPISVHPH
jgi:hypothetical protein